MALVRKENYKAMKFTPCLPDIMEEEEACLSILELPDEIRMLIYEFLDFMTLMNLRKVCKKFKIESIAGFIDCKHDISICYKKQKEIDNDIKQLFQNAKREVFEYKHAGDKTGNTKEKDIVYVLKSKAEIGTAVIDYGKEWTNDEGRQDHLQVFVDSKKYAKFLKTSAW